jgi:hypothetical protein
MATIRLKWGSVWVGPIADGKIAVKWGSAWVRPSKMSVKNGTTWGATDYEGYPSEPTGLAVNAWATHEAASFKWTAGAGGAAATSFEVMVRNSAGTTATTGSLIATKTDTASPSVDFTEVVQNTQYNVYVRALSAAGLPSDWVGPLQIKMGKDSSSTTTTKTGTRPYSLAKSVVGYKDAAVGPVIPTNVTLAHIRYQITNGFSGVLSPYGTHSISRWGNSAEGGQFSWPSASIDTTINVAYVSNGGVQGMICRGSGWSTAASGSYVATGTITVTGTETYQYQETTTIPAVANSYW